MLVVLFAFTMIVMGFVGVVIERVAYRPLRNAPRLAPLITAIGVSFILQNIVQGVPPYFGYGPFNTNSPQIFPTDAFIKIGNTSIPVLSLFIVAVALGLMIALQFFVGRTRIGRSMRSTAADREAASLMGVNINRTIAITFFIGSALAGAAGVRFGLQYGNTRYDVGFQAGLIAFTAAVLGGIGNTMGAALGGFMIGFIEVGSAVAGYNAGARRSSSAPSSSCSSSDRRASSASRRAIGRDDGRRPAVTGARGPGLARRVRTFARHHRSTTIIVGDGHHRRHPASCSRACRSCPTSSPRQPGSTASPTPGCTSCWPSV